MIRVHFRTYMSLDTPATGLIEDVEVELTADVTEGHDGRWGGPPECCEPPEPAEVEVWRATVVSLNMLPDGREVPFTPNETAALEQAAMGEIDRDPDKYHELAIEEAETPPDYPDRYDDF